MRVWGWTEPTLAVVLGFLASVGAIYKVAYYDSSVAGGVVWPTDGFSLAVLLLAVVLLLREFVMRDTSPVVPTWAAVLIGALLLAALVVVYVHYMPRWLGTADSADALDVGLTELLAGRDPYLAETFLGNRVSPMLGGLILAWPFYASFDSAGVQTLGWLVVGAAFLFRVAGPRGLVALLALALASPIIRLNLVTQFDHLVIAIVLSVAGSLGYFAVRARSRPRVTVVLVASAVGFGIALADRFIYAVTLIPLAIVMVRTGETRRAWGWIVVAGAVAAALVALPFLRDRDAYLSGPFSLGVQKAGGGDSPTATVVIVLITLLVLVAVSWRVRTLAGAWLGSGVVLGTLMMANIASIAVEQGWSGAFTKYVAVDYNGAWLLLCLVGLVLPRAFVLDGGVLPAPVMDPHATREGQPAD